jgi:hypothetical protein
MISRVLTPPGHPAGPDLSIKGIPPGAPTITPLRVVYVTADGTVATTPADSLITADGAPVYATGRGSWGQVRAAGRP